jgi:hypothetical protein
VTVYIDEAGSDHLPLYIQDLGCLRLRRANVRDLTVLYTYRTGAASGAGSVHYSCVLEQYV